MFCSKCGANQAEGVSFCSSCGSAVGAGAFQASAEPLVSAPVAGEYMTATKQSSNKGAGLALAIIGLVVSAFSLFGGLYDLGGIGNGQFAYIASSEIGLLATLSIVGIVLGSISMGLKHPAGRWALVVALASLIVMFNCAGHILPSV
jgi:hypothetical protein